MTKYLVSGYIGFDNFGDEAIQKVLTQNLKKNGAEKITLISSNPEKTKMLYDVESCGMLDFFSSLIKSDVLISGGGSLLQDVTSLKSLIYYLGVIYSALIFNKKVEIYAQGIGPINSKIGKFFTKFALKRVERITVRDSESQEFLKKWGIKSELVNDPILDLEFTNKHMKGTVGVQLRSFKLLTDDFLLLLAKEIKNKFPGKHIKIISLQDSCDMDVCISFKTMLNNNGFENVEIKNNLKVDEVIDEVLSLEYFVAMRFHACVIGAKSGIKTLCINYDPKVRKLAEEYNLPFVNLDDSNLDVEFKKLIQI